MGKSHHYIIWQGELLSYCSVERVRRLLISCTHACV